MAGRRPGRCVLRPGPSRSSPPPRAAATLCPAREAAREPSAIPSGAWQPPRRPRLPATCSWWDATMVEYDRKSEVYEYGYHVGHRALFSLRPGESLVRDAGNRGLHVNMETDPGWDGLKACAPENDLVYVNEFFPGYRGGVVANGTHRYAPNLKAGDLAIGPELVRQPRGECLTLAG